MKKIKRQGTFRGAILTDQQRINIKKGMSEASRNKLHAILTSRFSALEEDVRLISNSSQLSAWKFRNQSKIQNVWELLFQIKSFSATLYTDILRHERRGKDRIFWLVKDDNYAEIRMREGLWNRITEPDFSLRKIRSYIRKAEELSLLRDAIEKEIIPRGKENAITLTEISKQVLISQSLPSARSSNEENLAYRVKTLQEIRDNRSLIK